MISGTGGDIASDSKGPAAPRSQPEVSHSENQWRREAEGLASQGGSISRSVSRFPKRERQRNAAPGGLAAPCPRGRGGDPREGLRTARPLKWTQQTSKTSCGPRTGHKNLLRTEDLQVLWIGLESCLKTYCSSVLSQRDASQAERQRSGLGSDCVKLH